MKNGKLKRLGRIDMHRDRLAAFAATLSANDIVIVEATGNAAAVADVIAPHVKRVAIANPKQVRVIAHAKIKTDRIDAGVLGAALRQWLLAGDLDCQRGDAGAAPSTVSPVA